MHYEWVNPQLHAPAALPPKMQHHAPLSNEYRRAHRGGYHTVEEKITGLHASVIKPLPHGQAPSLNHCTDCAIQARKQFTTAWIKYRSNYLETPCRLHIFPRIGVSVYGSWGARELLGCDGISQCSYYAVSLAKCIYISTWRYNNIICSRWPELGAVFKVKWLKYFSTPPPPKALVSLFLNTFYPFYHLEAASTHNPTHTHTYTYT
jgi:hypothetical protein